MLVLVERTPAGKAQSAAGTDRGGEIGEGRRRVGEKHDAEARGDQVEPARLELVGLRVGLASA